MIACALYAIGVALNCLAVAFSSWLYFGIGAALYLTVLAYMWERP